jgi:hypothetical protein
MAFIGRLSQSRARSSIADLQCVSDKKSARRGRTGGRSIRGLLSGWEERLAAFAFSVNQAAML